MGGVAVAIDWDQLVAATAVDPMLGLIPHRSTAGIARLAHDHAVMAETHARPLDEAPPRVATIGHLSMVGDLRLWNRDTLRSLAGGSRTTAGMTDRQLILAAFLRAGLESLDAVDGDFAFVIWDDRERRAVAVRDRFGVKPLFFEAGQRGIRFASEPKQLVATSTAPVSPDPYVVSEYLLERYREARRTFFTGIERVPPATALIVDADHRREVEYWTLDTTPTEVATPGDVVEGFRDHLVDSVDRRLASSERVVGHLSGGLDSSSIAAAAHVALGPSNTDTARYQTASAVFPGSTIDETRWIDEIVSIQPFPHHAYTPEVAGLATFEDDMWTTGQPRVDRIRSMWADTAGIASRVGADLVVTGIGGDEILNYYLLFADRLNDGSPLRRWNDVKAHAAWRGISRRSALVPSLRTALPDAVKTPLRRVRRRPTASRGLLSDEAWETYQGADPSEVETEFGFPSDTQNLTVAASRHPLLVWSNEMQESEYASLGLDLSHPYLDKSLIEFVVSIAMNDRPFDGRPKVLLRDGFADRLPASVTSRRDKAYADDYLTALFAKHLPGIRLKYPDVSPMAEAFLDRGRYQAALTAVDKNGGDADLREGIWGAWTLMAWLDGLRRYRQKEHSRR